jgi:type IV secretory pathway TrbF-like protein
MHQWIIDREAQQAYVSEALALVQQAAINELDSFFRSNNPFTNLGERTQSIVIEPPLKQTEKTWVVYFTPMEKNRAGYETRRTRYSALINLDLYEPSLANPLGIYITNFDIKRVEEKKS